MKGSQGLSRWYVHYWVRKSSCENRTIWKMRPDPHLASSLLYPHCTLTYWRQYLPWWSAAVASDCQTLSSAHLGPLKMKWKKKLSENWKREKKQFRCTYHKTLRIIFLVWKRRVGHAYSFCLCPLRKIRLMIHAIEIRAIVARCRINSGAGFFHNIKEPFVFGIVVLKHEVFK